MRRTRSPQSPAATWAALALVPALLSCAASEDAADSGVAPPPGTSHRMEIVDRAIERHGGELFERSRIRLTVTSRSGSFDVDSTSDGERFEHVIRTTDLRGAATEHRRDNEALQIMEDGRPMAMDEAERRRAESYVNQRMYFLLLPYKLNDPGAYKEDQGLEQWGERQLHRVRVTFEPDSSDGADSAYVYWFDPETARLEQFAYDYSNGTGLRFRTLDNYREVGGLLFYDADNYGLNTPDGGLTVDDITPAYASELPLVSRVELQGIDVRRTGEAADAR